jgi:hypothetical protein
LAKKPDQVSILSISISGRKCFGATVHPRTMNSVFHTKLLTKCSWQLLRGNYYI